jgi:hypothetical protein
MMYSIAHAYYSWTTTPSCIYIDVPYIIRLYETGVVGQAVLILYITTASGFSANASGTEVVPASTVLTNK